MAISTSGRSANVLAGAVAARQAGCAVVGLTGAGGGPLAELVDVLVDVDSGDVPRIQEVHALSLHAWVAELERTMPASGTFEERLSPLNRRRAARTSSDCWRPPPGRACWWWAT